MRIGPGSEGFKIRSGGSESPSGGRDKGYGVAYVTKIMVVGVLVSQLQLYLK